MLRTSAQKFQGVQISPISKHLTGLSSQYELYKKVSRVSRSTEIMTVGPQVAIIETGNDCIMLIFKL